MGKGKAITGLVLGIVAMCFCWFWITALIALPMAIVGLCLSVSGGKQMQANGASKGLGVAGMVVGIVATVLSAIMFFACGVCGMCVYCEAKKLEAAVNAWA